MSYNKGKIKIESTAKKPKNPYKDDVIWDPKGQWKHPGQITRIPSGDISMYGVPYPVFGIDDLGSSQMMYPGSHYKFPGSSVTEYPMMAYGGTPHRGQIYDRLGRLHSVKSYVPGAQDGGWLDDYQSGGNAVWDFSTLKMSPQKPLPTAATYTQPTQNVKATAKDHEYQAKLNADEKKAERLAIAMAAQESGTRGVPIEYVPVEAAFLPPARGLGWAGNMIADAVTGTMRSPLKGLPKGANEIGDIADIKRLQGLTGSSKLGQLKPYRNLTSDGKLIPKHLLVDPGNLPPSSDYSNMINRIYEGKAPFRFERPDYGDFHDAFTGWSEEALKNKELKEQFATMQYGKQPLLKNFQFAQTPEDVVAMMKEQMHPNWIINQMPHWFDIPNLMNQRRRTLSRMLQSDYLDRAIVPNGGWMRPDNAFMKKMNAFPNMTLDPKRNIFTDYKDYAKTAYPEYTPYTGQEAFQEITPNKYGGSNNWLDDYNT